MTGWSTAIVARFRSLFNIDGLSDEVAEYGPDGESEDGKASRLVATARVRNANDVQTVHEALTECAFSGYRGWHSRDDDDWMKHGLASMLSEDQSGYLVSVLREPSPADLSAIVRTMAGQFVPVWREQARSGATEMTGPSREAEECPGFNVILNEANWRYSRTPGTRYYIYHGGQYLFSDDQNAQPGDWTPSRDREEAAKNNAVQWAPGIFYTPYADPSLVGGIARVYGLSEDGPWILTEEEALALASAQAQAIVEFPAPAPAPDEVGAWAGGQARGDHDDLAEDRRWKPESPEPSPAEHGAGAHRAKRHRAGPKPVLRVSNPLRGREGVCGYFTRTRQLHVLHAGLPGVIVQKVTRSFDVERFDDDSGLWIQISGSDIDSYVGAESCPYAQVSTYWELWRVRDDGRVAGQTDSFSLCAIIPPDRDSENAENTSRGSFTIEAEMLYYEAPERDMTIVATQLGFADDSNHPAGQLPHRDDDPAEDLMGLGFEPVGNSVRFKVTSSWDSGQKGEVLSKVETS